MRLLWQVQISSPSASLIAQVELEHVDEFDLGYEGIWPIAAAGATSTIAAANLRSDDPLISPPGFRFTYSYPFAASGDAKAFNQSGGYYQVICEGECLCLINTEHQKRKRRRTPYSTCNLRNAWVSSSEAKRYALPQAQCKQLKKHYGRTRTRLVTLLGLSRCQ